MKMYSVAVVLLRFASSVALERICVGIKADKSLDFVEKKRIGRK